MGSFRGSLASVPAPRLGSVAIRGAVDRAGRSGDPGASCLVALNPCLMPLLFRNRS